MRILMVGAGATGGFYGAKLVQAGRDVTFLLRDRRAAQIREHGLSIVDPKGDLTVHPQIISADQLREARTPFELIIISTKSYQLEGAMRDIAPAVGPETMILPVLNGMRQITILRERFGAEHVLGGSVRIVSNLDEQGRVEVLANLDQMSYGELSGVVSPRIQTVDAVMKSAGFTAVLEADVVNAMWQKWWMLTSMGAICVLAGGTIGQAARVPRGTEMERAVTRECVAIATANGYPPQAAMVEQMMARFTDPSSSLTSSMYRDMTKGLPVEVDHILGDLLDRAGGLSTPLLTAAYVQLKVYEATRGR